MTTEYKLVPIEPTDEMVIRGAEDINDTLCLFGIEIWDDLRNGTKIERHVAESCFKAMFAAAPAVQKEPSLVVWVLFDATTDKKYIKVDERNGLLAFFESEADALRAKQIHPGTDYKRCEYYTAPQPTPDVANLVEAASRALDAIGNALNEAYRNAGVVCCGRPGSECCGSPEPEWPELDQAIMDKFAPIHGALVTALAAYRNVGVANDPH